MIRCVVVIFVALLAGFGGNLHAEPRVAEERIVLSTDYGDLVLALYPDVAPRHVEQLLKLVRIGAYDSTRFFRIIPGFIVQLSDVNNRSRPLSAEQVAAVSPIKAEFSNLKHRKGVLSMARWDNPDSATSSFSIMLNEAPHLDYQYTIFGELESGGSVINRILGVPRENDTPKKTISVRKAYVVYDMSEYYKSQPFDPVDQIGSPIPAEEQLSFANRLDTAGMLNYIALLLVGVVITGLIGFFMFDKLSKSWLLSLLLINVLISGFVLFTILIPVGHENSLIAAGLFMAVFGMFRLMSNFENKKG